MELDIYPSIIRGHPVVSDAIESQAKLFSNAFSSQCPHPYVQFQALSVVLSSMDYTQAISLLLEFILRIICRLDHFLKVSSYTTQISQRWALCGIHNHCKVWTIVKRAKLEDLSRQVHKDQHTTFQQHDEWYSVMGEGHPLFHDNGVRVSSIHQ